MAHQTVYIALLVFALTALLLPCRRAGEIAARPNDRRQRGQKAREAKAGSEAGERPERNVPGHARNAAPGRLPEWRGERRGERQPESSHPARAFAERGDDHRISGADRLFNIIPGNSNLVTVEESPTKENGSLHHRAPGGRIRLPGDDGQRQARARHIGHRADAERAGAHLSFLPGATSRGTGPPRRRHLRPRRGDGGQARRGSGRQSRQRRRSEATHLVCAHTFAAGHNSCAPPDETAPAHTPTPRAPLRVGDTAEIDTTEPPAKLDGRTKDPARAASLALTEATRSPKSFKKWSNSVHGLSLSTSPVERWESARNSWSSRSATRKKWTPASYPASRKSTWRL